MTSYLKFIILSVIILSSCVPKKKLTIDKSINTELNKEYIDSRRTFKGKFNEQEYAQFMLDMESALNSKIQKGKVVLINYSQKGTNCIFMRFDEKVNSSIIENSIKISSNMIKDNNAVDYFVYKEDTFYKELYEQNERYILDSGFFSSRVFTLQENCGAFFILKPSGDFMKYYGEDYFTQVKNYLTEN